jgi:hypothetical protein
MQDLNLLRKSFDDDGAIDSNFDDGEQRVRDLDDEGIRVAGEPEQEPVKDPQMAGEESKRQDTDPFSSNQYNLDDSVVNDNDGQINKIMTQNKIQHPKFKTKYEKDIQARNNQLHPRSPGLCSLMERRPGSQDPYELSYQLIYDINIVSTQIFSLWYQFFEVISINPKFVCEFLRIVHDEKMREYWGELIYRTICETLDFTQPSTHQNVQEIHKQIAMKRRGLMGQEMDQVLMKSTFTDLNVIEISDTLHATSGPAG